MKNTLQSILGLLGYRLVRSDFDDGKIGMELCLNSLAARGVAPASVLDVGAATGQWTRLALKYWPDARYWLLEPLEERKAQLTELSDEWPNVKFILTAAGPASCEMPIGILPDALDGSSFLYGALSRVVPVRAVDDLLRSAQIEQPQFMKLDVQGFELEVLKGGELAMRGCPLVLLELQFFRFTPSMRLLHESIGWMAERGFLPYEIVDVWRRPYDGAMGQCDMLFVQEGHWLVSNNSWA